MRVEVVAFVAMLALAGGGAAALPVLTDMPVHAAQHAMMLGLLPAVLAFVWWLW